KATCSCYRRRAGPSSRRGSRAGSVGDGRGTAVADASGSWETPPAPSRLGEGVVAELLLELVVAELHLQGDLVVALEGQLAEQLDAVDVLVVGEGEGVEGLLGLAGLLDVDIGPQRQGRLLVEEQVDVGPALDGDLEADGGPVVDLQLAEVRQGDVL